MQNPHHIRWERNQWFRDARYGMFIHWGLYAIPARGEWVRSQERLTVEDYQPYFDTFKPDSGVAREWAQLAVDGGMKYVVLTAKHHDGFCLFDSQLTDYKSTNTPAGRDLIGEYVEACRDAGLQVGIYYSLPDWHHPDFPAFGDRQHPMRDNTDWASRKHDLGAYVDYMHGQVHELLTRYGKIDILWFDFSYEHMRGEAWRASDLMKMVRRLQPDILVSDRLGGDLRKTEPEDYAGDFAGPEQVIPRQGVRSRNGQDVAWESCITLNNSWGYNATDMAWKDPGFVIRTLVKCVSKGGNLLINVGPDARGHIPLCSQQIIREVGEWLDQNGASIYGCGPAGLPRPDWGVFTRSGQDLYAHLLEPTVGHLCLPGLKNCVRSATRLADGAEVILTDFWNGPDHHPDEPDDIYMALGRPVHLTYQYPDQRDTVVHLPHCSR